MSLITTQPQVSTTELLTLPDILKRYLAETQLGTYGELTAVPDAGTVVDTTTLKSSQYSSEEYSRCWLYIPALGVRPISVFTPELGQIEVDPPFATTASVGDEYFVFRWPHPQRIFDHINTILKTETYLPIWTLLTEVPNGDFELGTSTEWAAYGTATLSVSSSVPAPSGLSHLVVTSPDDTGTGAELADAIFVEPGHAYHMSVEVRCPEPDSQAVFQLVDADSDVVLTSVSTSRRQWVRMYIDLQIPADTNAVKFRLINTYPFTSSCWNNVCFFPEAAQHIALPAYIKDAAQVKAIFRLTPESMNADNLWQASLQGRREFGWYVRDNAGTGRLELYSDVTRTNLPLYILAVKNELPYDTTLTTEARHIDPNWMHAQLMFKVYSSMSAWPGAYSTGDRTAVKEALASATAERNRQLYRQTLRIERVLNVAVEGDRQYGRAG